MKTLKAFFVVPFVVLTLNTSASLECLEGNEIGAFNEEIQQLLPKVEEKVSFSDEITASSINSLLNRIHKLIEKNEGRQLEITLTLASGGGNVNETIRAVNTIRQLNLDPLITINTIVGKYSSCESACTILYTAGEKRFASKNSQFGFHSPKFESGNKQGKTTQEIEDLYRKIWIGYVSSIDQNSATIIQDRRYLMDHEMSYMTGKELNSGYVTDII